MSTPSRAGLQRHGYQMGYLPPCVVVGDDRMRMWYEGGGKNGKVRTPYAETGVESLANGME